MSQQIDSALVQGYRAGIAIKYQQMTSRLEPYVRVETQNAEFEYYDRIGPTDVTEITTRHGDTPFIQTPHDRRRVGLRDFDWADLIDKKDRLRMLSDPDSPYTMNAIMALNRKKDDVLIQAAIGTAYSGKNGGTAVVLPTTQTIYSDGTAGSDGTANAGGTVTNFNIGKLIRARIKMQKAEAVIDQQADLVAVISPDMLAALLLDVKVTSADYQAVKALVAGEIDTLFGFKFILSNRIPTVVAGEFGQTNQTGHGRAIIFERQGLLLAKAQDPIVRVDELAIKRYATQIYVAGSFAATRMWEDKVVQIFGNTASLT